MMKVFRYRSFTILWLMQVLSGIGDVLYSVGLMVTIFETTGSALQTIGVMVSSMVPPILLSPFAGATADRFPRRVVMVVMLITRASIVLFLLLFIQAENFNILGIYLVVAGLAAASTFFNPAKMAILPTLVPKDLLVQANSLMIGTNQATLALGYLAGGILILQVPIQIIVIAIAATYLFGGILALFIHSEYQDANEPNAELEVKKEETLLSSIREGLAYLKDHKIARPLVVMEVLEHVPHGIWTSALLFVFVKEALGGTAVEWGYQSSAYFLGLFLGAILASMTAKYLLKWPGLVIAGNALLSGIMAIIYANSTSNLTAIMLAFMFGLPNAQRDVAQDTLLQISVSTKVLGRIFAMRSMFLSVAYMASGTMFAWLADFISIRWIYALGGILYIGTSIYAFFSKGLRESRIEDGELQTAPAAMD